MPDAARVAILNGFGRSLGDSVIGLQALSAALALGALDRPPVLFRLPGLSPIVQDVYRVAADLCEVRDLPWSDATPERRFPPAERFARVIDIRDFAFDPAFRGVAMIDYFLGHLGLDPAVVAPQQRRNAWLAPRLTPSAWPDLPRGYALVCPRTSMPLRDMPDEAHLAIIETLTGLGRRVVSQTEPCPGAIAARRADSFAELCGLVAGAALIVSADTAIAHLADAFAVPCLTFFTTHRPEWRVRDYPRNRAVHLPVEGLPAALEFARDDSDLRRARAAWHAPGADLAWLRSAVTDFVSYFR